MKSDARPRLDISVSIQENGDLMGREVFGPGEARQHRVVPVPPVESGMRDKTVEAGSERDGRCEDEHGQYGTDDGRANRRGAASPTRFEGEAHARD